VIGTRAGRERRKLLREQRRDAVELAVEALAVGLARLVGQRRLRDDLIAEQAADPCNS
jgi:hypothetical protein